MIHDYFYSVLSFFVATLDDYEGIYNVSNDLFSTTLEQSVPKTVVETVIAVEECRPNSWDFVTIRQLANHLKLDPSTTRRRVYEALEKGYLVKNEKSKNRLEIDIGDPLPSERKLFPTPDELRTIMQSCSKKSENGGGS